MCVKIIEEKIISVGTPKVGVFWYSGDYRIIASSVNTPNTVFETHSIDI